MPRSQKRNLPPSTKKFINELNKQAWYNYDIEYISDFSEQLLTFLDTKQVNTTLKVLKSADMLRHRLGEDLIKVLKFCKKTPQYNKSLDALTDICYNSKSRLDYSYSSLSTYQLENAQNILQKVIKPDYELGLQIVNNFRRREQFKIIEERKSNLRTKNEQEKYLQLSNYMKITTEGTNDERDSFTTLNDMKAFFKRLKSSQEKEILSAMSWLYEELKNDNWNDPYCDSKRVLNAIYKDLPEIVDKKGLDMLRYLQLSIKYITEQRSWDGLSFARHAKTYLFAQDGLLEQVVDRVLNKELNNDSIYLRAVAKHHESLFKNKSLGEFSHQLSLYTKNNMDEAFAQSFIQNIEEPGRFQLYEFIPTLRNKTLQCAFLDPKFLPYLSKKSTTDMNRDRVYNAIKETEKNHDWRVAGSLLDISLLYNNREFVKVSKQILETKEKDKAFSLLQRRGARSTWQDERTPFYSAEGTTSNVLKSYYFGWSYFLQSKKGKKYV